MSDGLFAEFRTCACGRILLLKGENKEYNGMLHQEHSHCITLTLLNKKDNPMDFTSFVRKPFVVQALEITRDNIEEVAKAVGDLRYKDDETPYILVDPRLVPSVEKVYVGFYMTKMGENVRCYSRRIFREQFMELDDSVQPWLDFLNKEGKTDDVVVS